MDVNMFNNAGSGDSSQIDADVESIGLHHPGQRGLAASGKLHEFSQFLVRQTMQIWNLPVRQNQNVTACVGKGIEQREAISVANNDVISFVIARLRDSRKNRNICRLSFRREDVLDAPGGVQRFHFGER